MVRGGKGGEFCVRTNQLRSVDLMGEFCTDFAENDW
jgi:hypothetical protein